MDKLQAQHAFDQIEHHLSEIKNSLLSNNDWEETPEEMADRISELEDDLEDANEDIKEKESEVSALEEIMSIAADELESYMDSLESDHPGYSTDVLKSIIKTLRK